MTKNEYKIAKIKINEFLRRIAEDYDLYAPVENGTSKYGRISDPSEISLGSNRTDVSAKRIFFPPEEVMFHWERKNGDYVIQDAIEEGRKIAIFGLRGCDLRALEILDRYMLGEFSDPYYGARRNAVLIGITCDYPRDSCFCTAFGGMKPPRYDLWLTDIGDHYLVEVGSTQGEKLIYPDLFEEATEDDISRARRKVARIEEMIEMRAKINLCETKRCSQNIKKKAQDEIWRELAEICLCCGKCNFICPTCHCFDVRDFVSIDGNSGMRVRVWDSCHLYEYARTSAENFRKERDARVRYRIYDKFVFPVMRYGTYACVGCGRCTDVCPAGIDIREVLRRLIS